MYTKFDSSDNTETFELFESNFVAKSKMEKLSNNFLPKYIQKIRTCTNLQVVSRQ